MRAIGLIAARVSRCVGVLLHCCRVNPCNVQQPHPRAHATVQHMCNRGTPHGVKQLGFSATYARSETVSGCNSSCNSRATEVLHRGGIDRGVLQRLRWGVQLFLPNTEGG